MWCGGLELGGGSGCTLHAPSASRLDLGMEVASRSTAERIREIYQSTQPLREQGYRGTLYSQVFAGQLESAQARNDD